MSRFADHIGLHLRRALCPLLAHDWTFRNVASDGRCTACCRVCGKCEPARVLVRSLPTAPASHPDAIAAPAPAANGDTPGVAA